MVNTKEAVRSLLASKQRTGLALLGVVIGIGSVMAMLAVGETVKSAALKQFQAMGTDIITLSPGYMGEKGQVIITNKDLAAVGRYAKSVRRVVPELHASGEVVVGKAKESVELKGVTLDYFPVNRLVMARGRFLTPLDRGLNHAVIGSRVIKKLLTKGAKTPIKRLIIAGQPFELVGVLAPANLGFRSREVDDAVFVDLHTARRFADSPGISRAMIQLGPDADHGKASAEIKNILKLLAGKPVPLNINSPKQLLKQMAEQMRLFTLLLAAVGSISLIVGGVGIMNMMLVSVAERRKEIGIRRALGGTKGDIVSQFLVESVILSLAGGLIGLMIGVGAVFIVSYYQDWDPVVPAYAPGLCLVVALTVGVVFGYFPAKKAAGLEIISALRAD